MNTPGSRELHKATQQKGIFQENMLITKIFENFSENIFFFKISKIIFQEVEIISEGSGSLLCF
jgi:hypothetical protein